MARPNRSGSGDLLLSSFSRPGTPMKQGSSISWNFRQSSPTRTDSRASNQSILSLDGIRSQSNQSFNSFNHNGTKHHTTPNISPVLTATFATAMPKSDIVVVSALDVVVLRVVLLDVD